jgi:hypothetical protein
VLNLEKVAIRHFPALYHCLYHSGNLQQHSDHPQYFVLFIPRNFPPTGLSDGVGNAQQELANIVTLRFRG